MVNNDRLLTLVGALIPILAALLIHHPHDREIGERVLEVVLLLDALVRLPRVGGVPDLLEDKALEAEREIRPDLFGVLDLVYREFAVLERLDRGPAAQRQEGEPEVRVDVEGVLEQDSLVFLVGVAQPFHLLEEQSQVELDSAGKVLFYWENNGDRDKSLRKERRKRPWSGRFPCAAHQTEERDPTPSGKRRRLRRTAPASTSGPRCC